MSKPYELEMTALPGSSFFRNGDTLSSEASQLGFKPGRAPYERIYSDACDVGIKIQGNTRAVRFVLGDCEPYDGQAWVFVPLDDAAGIKKVIIFND